MKARTLFMGRLVSMAFLAFMLVCPGVYAADSTHFDPTVVPVKASGAGVPVGSIVTWPASTNPADMDKWLECDGRTITRAAYPDLYAIVGAKVPDYRGMFLRGTGGNAAAVGVKQGDGINTSVPFQLVMSAGEVSGSPYTSSTFVEGTEVAGSYSYPNPHSHMFLATRELERTWNGPYNYRPMQSKTRIQATIQSGSPETRPVNMAVRYLIRARP